MTTWAMLDMRRAELQSVLDDVAESLERAYDLTEFTRPEVRAPIESALASVSEAQRRAGL